MSADAFERAQLRAIARARAKLLREVIGDLASIRREVQARIAGRGA